MLRLLDKSVIELSKMQLDEAKEIITFIPAYINIGDYNGAISVHIMQLFTH